MYGFAFPVLKNVSSKALRLTSLKLTHLPPGVRVVAYRVVNINDTHHRYIMSSVGGTGDAADYYSYPDYLARHVTIAPKKTSPYYPVVLVKATTAAVHGHMRGCQVQYTQSGSTFSQTFPCNYDLDGTN